MSTDRTAATEARERTEAIERVTGWRVRTSKVVNAGTAHLVVEVNGEWVFRFPRARPSHDRPRKQSTFLASFARLAPLAVPDPVYVTDDFVGYRKIAGAPLYPTHIERMRAEDRRRIAKQLGLFLATLHRWRDPSIDFDTGYLVMRHGYERSCPDAFATYLRASERRRLDAKLEAIAGNPANFVAPTTIIHGDLNARNMLWDSGRKVVTGIIDWSEMGLGIPAMDFIALADFTKRRNDDFLRHILLWYGAGDGLFEQVKENAVIEVMNWLWFYQGKNDPKGITRAVARLKRVLAA